MAYKTVARTTKAVKANQKHRSLRAPKSRNRAVWFSVTGVLILAVVLGSIFLITNVLSPAFKYRKALSFLDDGQLTEACAIFAQLGYYRDSDAYLELYSRQIMLNAEIGDIVYWGRYEQDNRVENGKEIIQWRVLDKKQNQMLLLSEKSLDEKPYNMKAADVTWETCTLRDWLNNTFIHEAFSSGEKSVIIRTELINEDNAEFGTDGGNNTFDNVFILSLNEVKIYLPEEASRLGCETTFAIVQYGKFDDNSPSWWLRTPGLDNQNALLISEKGEIFYMGGHITFATPIRPAIWVDLSSDVFVR